MIVLRTVLALILAASSLSCASETSKPPKPQAGDTAVPSPENSLLPQPGPYTEGTLKLELKGDLRLITEVDRFFSSVFLENTDLHWQDRDIAAGITFPEDFRGTAQVVEPKGFIITISEMKGGVSASFFSSVRNGECEITVEQPQADTLTGSFRCFGLRDTETKGEAEVDAEGAFSVVH